MKILHVITSLQIGGAEKLVAEIVPMLTAYGHQVDVVAFDDSEPNFSKLLTDKGIKVTFFGKGVYKLSNLFLLGRMMGEYDIVHTHNTSPQYFAAIASLWARKPKLVYTEHNTANRMRSIPGFSVFLKWVYGRYQKNICISDKAEDNLRVYLGVEKSESKLKSKLKLNFNICTIYNGVNVHHFHDASPIAVLHPEGKTVVVMVAAFRPQKDQDTLIKAFSYLPENKYELWIVGDGERRNELETLSQGKENIKFLGVRSDIPEILNTADIVVMSSHYEGLSLSSVEGMSVGKPFVASDVDGLHEVVEGYGILAPHQDANALADEITHLATDTTYYQQVADKCWQRAQMFDIQKMVEGYEKVYEEMMR